MNLFTVGRHNVSHGHSRTLAQELNHVLDSGGRLTACDVIYCIQRSSGLRDILSIVGLSEALSRPVKSNKASLE